MGDEGAVIVAMPDPSASAEEEAAATAGRGDGVGAGGLVSVGEDDDELLFSVVSSAVSALFDRSSY